MLNAEKTPKPMEFRLKQVSFALPKQMIAYTCVNPKELQNSDLFSYSEESTEG